MQEKQTKNSSLQWSEQSHWFWKSHCLKQWLKTLGLSGCQNSVNLSKMKHCVKSVGQKLLICWIQKQEGKTIKQYKTPWCFLGLLLGITRFFHLIVIVKDLTHVHHTENLTWISIILWNTVPSPNTQKCINTFCYLDSPNILFAKKCSQIS